MTRRPQNRRLTRLPRAAAAAAALSIACVAVPSAAPLWAQSTTRPASAARDKEAIQRDLDEAGGQLAEVMPSMDALADAAKRAEAAPKALPVMNRLSALFDEVVAIEPRARPQLMGAKLELTAMMVLLGDANANDTLKKMALSTDADEAAGASAWLLGTRWAAANKEVGAQQRMTAELMAQAKARPEQDMLAQVAQFMSQQAASPALRDQVEDVIITKLASPMSQRIAAAIEAERKLRVLENKPLVLEGVTADGKRLTTADWKGKVVLVDFWATWCGPCMAELPRVKKAYADHHDKGLEILGVSCDNDPDDLKQFANEHKDAPWPQLFNVKEPGWHPLAKQFGIEGIPTMFLIDKKGVVRSVTARENFEELIPKLLAE